MNLSIRNLKLIFGFVKSKNAKDVLFLCVYVLLFMLQRPITIVSSFLVATIYCFIHHNYVHLKVKYINIYIIIVALLGLSTISFNHGITPIFHLFFSPIIFIVASIFSGKNIKDLYLILLITQYVFLSIILFGLFYYFDDPDPLGSIIPWASRNGITSVLIVVQLTFSLVFFFYKRRLPLISSLLVVIICWYGLGRGSIVVSLLLLLFGIYFNVFSSKSLVLKFFVFACLLCVSYIIYDGKMEIIDVIYENIQRTQFGQGITDDARAGINREYLSGLDFFTFLGGASYDDTIIEKYYGGNPHNSFIRLHSFYGFFGIVFLAFVIIIVAFIRRSITQKLVTMVILVLILFRAVTEPILFPTALDLFFSIIVLVYLKKSTRNCTTDKFNVFNY